MMLVILVVSSLNVKSCANSAKYFTHAKLAKELMLKNNK